MLQFMGSQKLDATELNELKGTHSSIKKPHLYSHTTWVWVLVVFLTSHSGLNGGFQKI